jgi:hypothetical protein
MLSPRVVPPSSPLPQRSARRFVLASLLLSGVARVFATRPRLQLVASAQYQPRGGGGGSGGGGGGPLLPEPSFSHRRRQLTSLAVAPGAGATLVATSDVAITSAYLHAAAIIAAGSVCTVR